MKHVLRPEEPDRMMTTEDIQTWARDVADIERSVARHQLRLMVDQTRRDLGLPTRQQERFATAHDHIHALGLEIAKARA